MDFHCRVTTVEIHLKGRFVRLSRFWNKTISRNYFGWSNVYRRDPLWRTHRESRHEEHSLRINAVSVVSATFCISFSFLSFASFWQGNCNSVGQLLRSRNNPFLPPRERLSPAQQRQLRALLFSNSVWVLLCPAELRTLKSSETEPTVYRPYPRGLDSRTNWSTWSVLLVVFRAEVLYLWTGLFILIKIWDSRLRILSTRQTLTFDTCPHGVA